ncbi:YdcF family protein [Rhodoferax sp.]|uniref:YdcF family protein n=1 Tax=Rhodoferax sp. TaxID=50421 RepID=UPI0025F788AD|nr:YdcF family protein [Rhodoferax sp.]
MFILSKLIAWVTQPLFWLLLVLSVSWLVARRRPAIARPALGWSAVLLVLTGWMPLPDLLIRKLEAPYPEIALNADLSGYAGVVVLGGGTAAGRLQEQHSHPLLNSGGERLAVSAALALKNPGLPLIYTGGEGDPQGGGPSEAERARRFYDSLGIPEGQVRYEAASRNTYENAVLSAELPGVNPQNRWLLLTSAWHMARAKATFEKAGWNVTAYPVDFRAESPINWSRYSLQEGVTDWQMGLNEYVGWLAYRLMGRL